MVCVTCVVIEQLVPAWPPKKLKRRHTSRNDHILPPVVLRGCFAAKKGGSESSLFIQFQIKLFCRFLLNKVKNEILISQTFNIAGQEAILLDRIRVSSTVGSGFNCDYFRSKRTP